VAESLIDFTDDVGIPEMLVMDRATENAYLNAPCMEKIWFEGGLECGSDKGKVCVVVHALHGLKSAGASWCAANVGTGTA
jgi:hypothetical protein